MKAMTRSLTLIAIGTSLAACSGGPQFTGLEKKILLVSPAKTAVAQANASAVPADPYNEALRSAYLGYADFELNQMNDYGDAIFHANRATAAASGQTVEPQAVSERMLTASAASELGTARGELVEALNGGGRTLAPQAAATATASYDCWLEQAEEALQPEDIAACKKTFEQAMTEMNAAIAAQLAGEKSDRSTPALPDVVTLDSDVVFAFDSSTIEPSASDALVEVAELIKGNPGIALTIKGHTDSVGSDAYNLGLSLRRAESVQTYLVNQGVNPARFTVEALGESSPIASNDTAEGRAMNRRVDIHSQ